MFCLSGSPAGDEKEQEVTRPGMDCGGVHEFLKAATDNYGRDPCKFTIDVLLGFTYHFVIFSTRDVSRIEDNGERSVC